MREANLLTERREEGKIWRCGCMEIRKRKRKKKRKRRKRKREREEGNTIKEYFVYVKPHSLRSPIIYHEFATDG